VLRGDISFVGPRPERPEFIDKLAESIPCYKERLLVQPGLTGWAQVNYPYGLSVADARRKLEFDLYYMKNLSLLLDSFILLDTVKIILRGGASRHRGVFLTHFENLLNEQSEQLRLPDPTLSEPSDGVRLPLA
jgi:lipopolysaccharide/colanic/teichoic acid biosynthesis glycosyltransferase